MSLDSAIALIESVRDARVLFVGDAITDEYHYVTPLGKSPKEHLIVVQHVENEVFRGGVHAAADHARSFCSVVDLCASPSDVRKVRMVDKVYLRKLFEIHYGTVKPVLPPQGRHWYDTVVVTDFGHGAILPVTVEALITWPFLAVNAQTNSSNVGFNLITKYPRADYIVIDEPEARLAAQNRSGPIEDAIHTIIALVRCEKMIVTLGSQGAIGYDRGVFTRVPAMTQSIVDTMGAGDAFFAVTAPMARLGRMEDLLLIGNAAGALKTQIIGHRVSVTKPALIEYMRSHV